MPTTTGMHPTLSSIHRKASSGPAPHMDTHVDTGTQECTWTHTHTHTHTHTYRHRHIHPTHTYTHTHTHTPQHARTCTEYTHRDTCTDSEGRGHRGGALPAINHRANLGRYLGTATKSVIGEPECTKKRATTIVDRGPGPQRPVSLPVQLEE
jgi:hypothetical protein